VIEERVNVAKEPKKDLGLRVRMKVNKSSFSEELDIANVYIELYNKNDEVKESVKVKVELIPSLVETLKSYCKKSKKNRLVATRIVS